MCPQGEPPMHRRGSTLGKAISNGRRKVRAADCIAMARLGQGRLRAVLGMLTTVIGKAEAVRLANETVRELGNAPRK